MKILLLSALLVTAFTTARVRADVLPPVQDSSSLKGKLTAVSGKAGSLSVRASRNAFVLFSINSLPVDVLPGDIANARLRVYFQKAKAPGDISVHAVSGPWDETSKAPEPEVDGTVLATFPEATVRGKTFAEVDVTAAVQAWRTAPATNFGFAFVSSGNTNVLIGAKEGSGSGYPAELDVQIDRGFGGNLTLSGTTTGTFLGDGSGLSNLSANSLAAGTLPDARLTANVPLLNAGANVFIGAVTAGAFVGDGSGLTGIMVASYGDAPSDVFPVVGMVWIKPGTFIMGSRPDEAGRVAVGTGAEGPQTAVTLTKGYWMGAHEVTQAEYLAVTGTNPSTFTNFPTHPVETVTWNNAVAYCALLTTTERTAGRIPMSWAYRLPTEAEWEYACRAGARTTRYGFGDDLDGLILLDHAFYADNSPAMHQTVGRKLANPWGLVDMHGNVYEWCQDWIAPYPGGGVTDPKGPASGTDHVLRGGAYTEPAASCRSAARGFSPGTSFSYFGFRVVLSKVQP